MHKLEKDFCRFGDEHLRLREHLETLGKEKIVWESFRTVDSILPVFKAKAPVLSIELMFNADKTLKEARIVDRVKSITAKYDGSGKLVMDDRLLKHPEHMETAKSYEKQLGILLEHYLTKKPPIPEPQKKVQEPSVMESPKQAFQPHAMVDRRRLYIPKRIEKEMGFKKGNQVKVGLEEGRVVIELMDEKRYISRVSSSSGSLVVDIPSDLLDKIWSEEGNGIRWILSDASTVWATGRGSAFLMLIPSEVAKEKGIKLGGQVEWIVRERELTIKPVPLGEEMYLSTMSEVTGVRPYDRHLAVNIPKEISDKLDKKKWGKGMEGFEVVYDEHKKLVITPKQASQPDAIKTEELIDTMESVGERNRKIADLFAANGADIKSFPIYVWLCSPSQVERIMHSCDQHNFDWRSHPEVFRFKYGNLDPNLALCNYNDADPVKLRFIVKLRLPHEQFKNFLRDFMTAKGLGFREPPAVQSQ